MLSLKRTFIFTSILSFSSVLAQDAWILKEYYGKKSGPVEVIEEKSHFVKKSSLYQLDLNDDNRREYIGTKIVDGIPFLTIYDFKREKIFDHKFPISGFDSHIYRIRRRKISKDKVAVLFYLYNGKTSYIEKFGSSSLWAIIVENKNLEEIKIKNFGTIWTENTDNYGHYKRAHQISFQDINNDGQLDLVIGSGAFLKSYSHIKGINWRSL